MERLKLNSSVPGITLIPTVFFVFVLISGCATVSKKAEGPPFVETKKVVATAKIDSVQYFWKNNDLNVEVAIQNVSDKPKIYRVNIFIPNGPSGGGLYPKEADEEEEQQKAMKPKEKMKRSFPMYFNRFPDSIEIEVKEF